MADALTLRQEIARQLSGHRDRVRVDRCVFPRLSRKRLQQRRQPLRLVLYLERPRERLHHPAIFDAAHLGVGAADVPPEQPHSGTIGGVGNEACG